MKNKFATKKAIIFATTIIAVAILVGFCYYSFKNTTPDSPDTITLSEGRQIHFETLYIGLNSVSNNSAWLSVHKDQEEGSITKQVAAGDTIDIYGYRIEIKSVNKEYNFSIMPGSSHGNVKFNINKQ